MYYWFQNLNESGGKLFYFRGNIGSAYNRIWFRYEICSGPALSFQIIHGEAGDSGESTQISFGLFFFKIYITFFLPDSWYFQRKCVATWDGNREFYLVQGREYGFYFYEWSFVWKFHAKVHESSTKDPWWMHQYIHIDELFVGKQEILSDKLTSAEDIFFTIGNKEFKIDSIQFERNRRFRRFIPYALYHRTSYRAEIKIKNPPMFSGKGENSWDCGDDAIYGMSYSWDHLIPNWQNTNECINLATEDYIKHVLKNAKRYGGSDSETGIRASLPYSIVGRKNIETADQVK